MIAGAGVYLIVTTASMAMRWFWPPLVAALVVGFLMQRAGAGAKDAADRGDMPHPVAMGRTRSMIRTYFAACLGPAMIWYLLASDPPTA